MIIVEGTIGTKYSIEQQKRQVYKLVFLKDKHSKDLNYIKYLAHLHNIEITYEDQTFFQNYPYSAGVIAYVSARTFDHNLTNLVVLLDGIEDPYTIGYIARTLAAYNGSLILQNKHLENLEAQILKSSAGGYDYIAIHHSLDIQKTLSELKASGYRIIALDRSMQAQPIQACQLSEKLVICLGGEKRGLSKKVKQCCEQSYYLNYTSEFKNALNASSAINIVLGYYIYGK